MKKGVRRPVLRHFHRFLTWPSTALAVRGQGEEMGSKLARGASFILIFLAGGAFAAPGTPYNVSVTMDSPPMVSWTAPGALNSTVLVSTSNAVNPPTVLTSSQTVTGTSAPLSGLGVNRRYYVYVNACDGSGCSLYSNPRTIDTNANAPRGFRSSP
jgi:hypothetical protein